MLNLVICLIFGGFLLCAQFVLVLVLMCRWVFFFFFFFFFFLNFKCR